MNEPREDASARGHTIWDLPLRLYHGCMVVLLVLQFGTAEWGWLDMHWHFRFGYAFLALLLFRVAWAFAGSDNVRLRRLLSGPAALLDYARHWRTTPASRFAGHNPFGGWATVLIVGALLLQAISGLATGDDIEWFGPWADRLPAAWAARAAWLHHLLPNLILLLVAMHVIAVASYFLLKRENLVLAMWHGRRALDVAPPRLAGKARAAWILLACIAIVAALVAFGA